MKNEPKKIYIQIGEETDRREDFQNLQDLTFCKDRIYHNDIAYLNQTEVIKLAKWLLGTKGSFAPRPANGGLYWWRTELREKLKELGLNF